MENHGIVVVVPTYNERENIKVLISQLFDLHVSGLEVLVVDDSSPDGTADAVRELALKYPVGLIVRHQKMGLGTAYVEAFKHILNQPNNFPVSCDSIKKESLKKPDYIIQMDADLSHDSSIIPIFLEKIKSCDLVLGSRYIKGGGVENWNFLRRLISQTSNIYTRYVLGLSIKDLTGGFKCWRREVLEKIDLSKLSSVGYSFQIETTYKAYKLGFKICEVPIIFKERKTGQSKFNLGIIWESFIKVLWLRIKNF